MATPQGNGIPRQDMPPRGGYPMPEFARRMPKRFSGPVLWGAVFTVMGYGFLKTHFGKVHRTQVKNDRNAARSVATAYMQAEADADFISGAAVCEERERILMANVRGWEAGESVYHNKDIWVAPPEHYR